MNSQIIIFLLLTFSLDLNFGFECPQEGLRFKGDILETIVGLPAGWRYWQHCSKLCLDNPDWYESISNRYRLCCKLKLVIHNMKITNCYLQ